MKKNKFLKLASGLLVLCLLTTCVISTTFAKYTTSGDAQDTARVAKWGVTVAVQSGDPTTYGFAKEYKNGENVTVASSTEDKLVAPGTGSNLAFAEIQGTPEVEVDVDRKATLTLTGWEVDLDGTGANPAEYYCPIKITIEKTLVGGATTTVTYYGLDYASAIDFQNAVNAEITANTDYDPNTNLAENYKVSWAWDFTSTDGTEVTASDVKDTALGDKAVAGDITIKFELAITVTQID